MRVFSFLIRNHYSLNKMAKDLFHDAVSNKLIKNTAY